MKDFLIIFLILSPFVYGTSQTKKHSGFETECFKIIIVQILNISTLYAL